MTPKHVVPAYNAGHTTTASPTLPCHGPSPGWAGLLHGRQGAAWQAPGLHDRTLLCPALLYTCIAGLSD